MDNGIKWGAMPADFPACDRVDAFFHRWRDHRLITNSTTGCAAGFAKARAGSRNRQP
ncbi:hypothetical protein DMB38_34380 [Streptomyces sp. WAC 06738]|nr:hypothetical protein DMB38_34380 [Streptomyces sp. WAC 06738]